MKYDLNTPRIAWRIGFGDDPALAARGITGTGTPALLKQGVIDPGPGVAVQMPSVDENSQGTFGFTWIESFRYAPWCQLELVVSRGVLRSVTR